MVGLVWSLLVGLVVGGGAAALAMKVLGASTAIAFLLASLIGVVVGLVAGKPIWSKGGRIEAGLKAGFGALAAAGLLFVARRWLHVELDLGAAGLGQGPIALNPAVVFPAIATLLALMFEVDHMVGKDEPAADGETKARVTAGKSKVRVAELEQEVEVSDSSETQRRNKKS